MDILHETIFYPAYNSVKDNAVFQAQGLEIDDNNELRTENTPQSTVLNHAGLEEDKR